MKIKLNSIFVDDQDKALKFYTEILGFKKKMDIPIGKFRWLTVVSKEEPEGTQLVLEPSNNLAVMTFKKAIYKQGIPVTAFEVDDIDKEYDRLKKLGVKFRKEPTKIDKVTMALFDDTCGNLIQIYEV